MEKDLGEIAYEAYQISLIETSNTDTQNWSELDPLEQVAWREAANKAGAAYISRLA